MPFTAIACAQPPSGGALPDSVLSVEAPPGYVSFCLRFADQCAVHTDEKESILLTNAKWLTLQNINKEVNHRIRPMNDLDHYGRAEYWNIPSDGYGDCEDYALTKRKNLIEKGLPASALRIAIVRTPKGEGHAVLTVSTDRGDYVLDNLTDEVKNWRAAQYEWIERQDPHSVWTWTQLNLNREVASESHRQVPVGSTVAR